MFPLSADILPLVEIADFWSREIRPPASRDELLACLESAWWRGEFKGSSAFNRLQFLRKMFEARRGPDLQSVAFASPNDAGPPTEIPLADGGVAVVRQKICVPGETDDWTEDSCNDAFEALAQLPSKRYFPVLSYNICFIGLTYEEFFGWVGTRGFLIPGFWKSNTAKGEHLQPVASKTGTKEAPELLRAKQKVSEAEAHKIYAEYRRSREGITDRDEDIAYMKQYGVGRDWVRMERRKYPRRGRGEKKIKNQIGG